MSTAIEAVLATVVLTNDRGPEKITALAWSIDYSERNWTTTLQGKIQNEDFTVTITGYLWGEDSTNWLVSYSGSGTKDKEPIAVNGQAIWRYDLNKKDHTAMDFRHVVKFGKNSIWGWVVAAEIIVGGTMAGAGAILISSAATAGATVPAAPIIGAAAAIGGAAGMTTISANTKAIFTNPTAAPSPPPLPQRPESPQPGANLSPDKEKIYIAVGKDGDVWGSGPDTSLVIIFITGKLPNGMRTDGSGTGSISVR